MKKNTKSTKVNSAPARYNLNTFGQLFKLIPRRIVTETAEQFGVDLQCRTFSALSHLATMIFVQLVHAMSLNDVCDWLRLKARAIAAFGVSPPSRNNLSHANKVRKAAFMEQVFWRTLAHLHRCEPGFAGKRPGGVRKCLHRFKVKVHAIDSTVMELYANCMDWAKHRRRKAAAKMHLRLGLHGFLPTFAVVGSANQHDNSRARELCAGLFEGEVVVFDKAYIDFFHLAELAKRGVHWVTRAKDNLQYRAVKNLPVARGSKIIKDQLIVLKSKKFQGLFGGLTLRRVEAWVEVRGEMRLMVFLTCNAAWSPRSVCDLYRARWEIEVFFKQVKQTLKLNSFLGYSANAVAMQVWSALLVYVLLRFAAYLSNWSHSFVRVFAVVRAALFERWDLVGLLRTYGTAGGSFKLIGASQDAWLPNFEP